MKKVSFKGVIIGAITDIVSTNIVSLPLVLYITYSLRLSGLQHDKLASAVMETMKRNSVYFSLSLVLGGMCSVLGGYVSARIAKHDEVLNGALASILCVGSGIYTIVSGSSLDPLWQHLLFLPFSPALAALGGYLRLQQKRF